MRRNPPDLVLLLAIIALLAIGLIMVASASAPESLNITKGASVFHFGLRQLVHGIIGLVLLFIAMKTPYQNLKKFTVPIALITLGLLVAVLFLGDAVKGSRRWIDLGFFPVQPSELAKITVIIVLAHYLSEIKKGVTNLMVGVVLPLVFVCIICLLILLEPDLGTSMVIFGTLMIMMFAAGARMLHLGWVTLMGLAAGTVLVISEPYRAKRLVAFVDPWKDPQGDGWQIIQSLYALGSGGPFGLGLGMGRQKFDYLPEAHTDYIFSILGEELGLLGTVLVLTCFFILAWRGFKAALSAPDTFGRLLATGITSSIVLQAFLNIGVVTSSIPVTGITLPFLSYGGSSLIISLLSVGILLNISKKC